MDVPGAPVTIRAYYETDYDEVAALWTRINRELAPADMRELFEQYIATTINDELRQLPAVFSKTGRNAFWVVESGGQIVGTLGIRAEATTLRNFDACTSTVVIEAVALLCACCDAPSCKRVNSGFQR